jgi:Glycosyl transferase family 2
VSRVVALVPARNEADSVAATVSALRTITEVDEVLVIDDASSDGTSGAALAAGARVLRVERQVGKGSAMEAALRNGGRADVWLFADADLGVTARGLEPVLREVLAGRADLAVALPPRQEGGGFGIVKRAAARAIRRASGFEASAPLSGQRAITARALDACRPLATGFGVETAMTIDAVRAGFRVAEVPAVVRHRPTGRGVRGLAHRARQGLEIANAVAARMESDRTFGPLSVANYRGVGVPRTLGIVLAASAWIATFGWAGLRSATAAAWGALAGCLLVFAAGLVDDLGQAGPRGLRNHLRALAAGTVTTGVVKLVVAVGAAVVVVALEPSRAWWVRLVGVALVAASTNVWNALDVRPGRALKPFLPIGLAFVVLGEVTLAPAVIGVAVAAPLALWHDLRETAMLGDGGATLLGFAAGLALYLLLPGWGVALAALAAIGLNVVSETVTLSRAISSTPVLRRLDRLGRRVDPTDRVVS